MSSIQIPNLPAAIALSGAEQFEAVQSGVSVRVTGTQIRTLIATLGSNNMITTGYTTTTGLTNGQLLISDGTYVQAATLLTLLTAIANALPTSLPGSAGVLWNNGGVICLS